MVVFEDAHLLVADKPPGMNTHSPSPFAGEGLYEWLKNSGPDRAQLSILHRLDKETSGLIVFGKSTLANQSLTAQFERREVRKKYVLLTNRTVSFERLDARSNLARIGDRYASVRIGGEPAETRFRRVSVGDTATWEAEPLTGRTHQIRVHAAENGFPILGDTFYGGSPAARVCLHAAELRFRHPATNKEVIFKSAPDFSVDPRQQLRRAIIDPAQTNAFRRIHGAADGWPGLYVDQLGDFLLAQSAEEFTGAQSQWLETAMREFSAHGVYHKVLRRQIQKTSLESASPKLIFGEAAPEELVIRENGIQFALRFEEGYSVGLFLDQRANRRRLLNHYIGPDFSMDGTEILNTFAYPCGFSVCAAKGGARVTSLDLSRKYLEWGRRNFALNGLDPAAHDFIFGDVFDWLRRLAKKGRLFDVILLDPPTFSRSKDRGVFQVEKHYADLVASALPLLKREGILFASCNAAGFQPDDFLKSITEGASRAGRRMLRQQYVPQPPDFPLHRSEPAYLKTVWVQLGQ